MVSLSDITGKLVKLAAGEEERPVINAGLELIDYVRRNPNEISNVDVDAIFKALRSDKKFEAIKPLANGLIASGREDFIIKHYLGQALIDTGTPTAAIDGLKNLAESVPEGTTEWGEAIGLVGRAAKQVFADSAVKDSPIAKRALSEAIKAYGEVYQKDTNQYWHGINLTALLKRAEKEGVTIAGAPAANDIAGSIVSLIKEMDDPDHWAWATLAEAQMALGNREDAEDALKHYVESPGVDAFALASTARQFKEIWQLNEDEWGATMIAGLKAKSLFSDSGEVDVTPEDMLQSVSPNEEHFEKVFADAVPKSLAWITEFTQRAHSVGLVSKKLGDGIGTCFVVRGGDFHNGFGDELMVLTNDHVVSAHPEEYTKADPIAPDKAEITFEASGKEHSVTELIWSSGAGNHDATLLRVSPPIEVPALPIGTSLPLPDAADPERIYIIGHPGGRKLSLSMQNNELLNHNGPVPVPPVQTPTPKKLHYFTPTQRGHSGSPAMNSDLDVIGLHHAGSKTMPKLDGSGEKYQANEAIWIRSIQHASHADLTTGKKRWSS